MKATTLIPLAAAAALALALPSRAQEACSGQAGPGMARLTVEAAGVRPVRGEVATTIYPDDSRRFLARKGKLARIRAAAAATTRTCFWLPPGTYAVAVYHDKDGDHDFDRSVLGLPTEGFGFSNDAPADFGLPAFSAVRFSLPPGGRTLRIRMRYPSRSG